jgi:hypothetical protein
MALNDVKNRVMTAVYWGSIACKTVWETKALGRYWTDAEGLCGVGFCY